MKIKKGDNVLITAGKDKGKTGKILRAFPREMKVLVEGANVKKKHVKPRKEGEKGQVVDVSSPVNVSSVKIVCPKCKKAARVGYKVTDDKKFRVCKKCKQEI